AFVAIDVAAMTSATEFESRLRRLIDEIHAAKTADGVERVLLPGEREWAARRNAIASGIPLPADVVAKLRTVADESGIRPAWLFT
ncbi:MAG: Ldh family oxidoreductase, partial [Planctomycetota bacterium]|nr:Ldh family oxidoreductase [Planctomycetota bacterium]